MSDRIDAQHDALCESDFIIEAGAYTPCRCEERAERNTDAHDIMRALERER